MFRLCRFLRAADPISSIRKLLLRAPAHTVPLHAVAKQLPDAVMEELGEQHGGLRKFVESSPNLFSVKQVNGVFCVALNVPVALKPLVAGLTKQAPPTKAPRPKQPPEEAVASAAVAGIPSFMVPIEAIAARRQQSAEAVLEELKQRQAYLDIVVLPGGAASSGSGGSAYVRVLPPYKRLVDPTADSMYANEEAHDYDAYRLARHMSTVDYFLVTDLETAAAGTLSKPVPHVLLSYPELFDFDIERSRAKFILRDEYLFRLLPSEQSLEENGLTIHELEERLIELRRMRQRGELSTFKRMREHSKIVHILQVKKFPHGNPLRDPNVCAMFVYDKMGDGPPVLLDTVRSNILPENGRYNATFNLNFVERFPHLFTVLHLAPPNVHIVRSTEESRKAAAESLGKTLSEEELVLTVMSSVPQNFNPERPLAEGTLATTVPRHAWNAIRKIGFRNFVKRHPDKFDIVDDEKEGNMKILLRLDSNNKKERCSPDPKESG